MEQVTEFLKNLPEYLMMALALLGALKLIAKATKWDWDDKALAAIAKPLQLAAKLFPRKPPKA